MPKVCRNCRVILKADIFRNPTSPFLCSNCLKKLPRFNPEGRCSRCGRERNLRITGICGHGFPGDWKIEFLHCGFEYEGLLPDWLITFKHSRRQSLYFLAWTSFRLKPPQGDCRIRVRFHGSGPASLQPPEEPRIQSVPPARPSTDLETLVEENPP